MIPQETYSVLWFENHIMCGLVQNTVFEFDLSCISISKNLFNDATFMIVLRPTSDKLNFDFRCMRVPKAIESVSAR